MGRAAWLLSALLLALAALLRAPGLLTDFWLDEIWALRNVGALGSTSQVFTAIHHDSNHWLVSLWMYCLGQDASFWIYRFPSFLAGVAAVGTAGSLARSEGSSPTLAMLFTATSFPLGFYASEARGYALAALAGLVALLALVRWAKTGDPRWLAAYGVSASVGILAHLSFLIVLVSSVFFTLVLAARGRVRLWHALIAHFLPVGVLAALFWVDLRYVELGGGPRVPPVVLLTQTASLAIGGPIERPIALATLCVALLSIELIRRVRRFWPDRQGSEPSSLLWIFFAAAVVFPIWLTLVLDPPFLFPRYYLVSIAFVPLLLASLAASSRKEAKAALVLLWLGVNGSSWVQFAREGRGHYDEALEDILRRSEREMATVGSDHDFRAGTVVNFYRERMGKRAERLRYSSAPGADFWISTLEEPSCESCRLVGSYPSSSLSGARWVVWERWPWVSPSPPRRVSRSGTNVRP